MKNSTLVVLLLLTAMVSVRAERTAIFHVDNIVLKNFQAIQVPAGARVTWEFTSEEKDVICNVEKSTDGINFTVFAVVSVASTRQQAIHTFIDRQAPMGQTFYRLRVTKETYIPFVSPIVSLTISRPPSPDQQQRPLPGQETSMFGELVKVNELMNIKVVALNGHAKLNDLVKGPGLEKTFQPSFSRLPAGYYVLRVSDMNNKALINKFIYKF